MKMRNKGKVYPSPSSSSSSTPSSHSANRDAFSVLKLLPTAILALASVLSLEDREVLAYMITRSMMMTSSNPSSIVGDDKTKKKKTTKKSSDTHNPPVFDCGCFDCYRSYWFRWDSSSNRELIHQAIEAFEEHLANGEKSKKNNKGKKREKMGRHAAEKPADASATPMPEIEKSSIVGSPENDSSPVVSPGKAEEIPGNGKEEEVEMEETEEESREEEEEEEAPPSTAMVLRNSPASNHKGMARKVLPDVLGLFNSRLWSLWNPNV